MLNFSSFPFPATVVRALLTLLFLAFRLPASAQAPSWQSARAVAIATAASIGNSSQVTATAVGAAGNVFLAGIFSNTVVLGNTTLTSLGGYDAFVAKFNPVSNQFVWAQRAGGTGTENTTALAVSGTSVYIAGLFDGTTASFGATTLTNAGGSDVFIAKFTDVGPTGSFTWAQRAGGLGTDGARALAVSGTSIYVTGYFESPTAGFGTTTLNNASGNANISDIFVAKLNDAGNTGSFTWAQRAGGTGLDFTSALVVSGNNLYVAGNFDSPTGSFGAATLTNAGSDDVFVAKLTDAGSTGSFAWAQRAGGTNYDDATALSVSGTSVYLAGNFNTAASFGAATLTSAGSFDVFVAKLIDAGSTSSFAWAQRAGGSGYDIATALAVTGTSVYLAGEFRSATAGFGTTT